MMPIRPPHFTLSPALASAGGAPEASMKRSTGAQQLLREGIRVADDDRVKTKLTCFRQADIRVDLRAGHGHVSPPQPGEQRTQKADDATS